MSETDTPASERAMPDFVPETYLRHIGNIRKIAKAHGYTIATHGSLQRDIDLIAVPWIEDAAEPQVLAESICKVVDGHFSSTISGETMMHDKPHGRVSCAINTGSEEYGVYIDLSIMPLVKQPAQADEGASEPMAEMYSIRAAAEAKEEAE